jgi:hypothetical protein
MSLTLSLLMPTRNRARDLPSGVSYFLSTPREDIELIVCDASDDHDALGLFGRHGVHWSFDDL